MLEFEQRYAENLREIAALCDLRHTHAPDFSDWISERRQADARIQALRRENDAILSEQLFPLLDNLHEAAPEQIASLEQFGDVLMDWKTNLDVGVYILIHDSLLSLYRFRKDRNNIIKELYKLGMGLYYRNRCAQGLRSEHTDTLYFENEMVFTEAGSYFKFFEQIEDEPTKGFIIRALANIAICTKDYSSRIAVSARVLNIVRDDYYRKLAPGLPWDVFLRRTDQQMSSNRSVLSAGNLSTEELALILESCHSVFEPEAHADNPNIRWLWPYYEMEYTCGFVDLKTTLERMERLIDSTPPDRYDVSGLYGNVQLPIYYSRLIRRNPALQKKAKHLAYLSDAYQRMIHTLMTVPNGGIDDTLVYNILLVISDYYEAESVPPYEEVALEIMQRFAGLEALDSLRLADLVKAIALQIYRHDPGFFDDIAFLREIKDPVDKERQLTDYADKCGRFCDFGLLKMNYDRLLHSRNLFEQEFQIYTLHTVSGYDDLRERASTRRYADIAYGHHSWYNGAGGYPNGYVRNDSEYRQMTDVVAIAAYLAEQKDRDAASVISEVIDLGGSRFSPLVAAYLEDPDLQQTLTGIQSRGSDFYYRMLYDQYKTN